MITYEMKTFPEEQGVNIRVSGDLVGGDIPVDMENPEGERRFQSFAGFHVSELEPLLEQVKKYLSADVQPTKHMKAYVGRVVMGMFPVEALQHPLEFKVYEDLSYTHREGGELYGCFAEDPENPDYVFFIFLNTDGDEDVLDINAELPDEIQYRLPALVVKRGELESFEAAIAEAQVALAKTTH